MKRFSRFALFLLLCPLLLLPGCGQDPDGPAEVSATQGDFRATLSSARSVYDSGALDAEAPLNFVVRVDYLGGEKEVHIGYGADLGYVELCDGEGIDLLKDYNMTFPSYLQHGTLGPEEPFVETSTGKIAYELLEGLPAGSYVAKTHVSFRVFAGDPTESTETIVDQTVELVELDLELPFEIR